MSDKDRKELEEIESVLKDRAWQMVQSMARRCKGCAFKGSFKCNEHCYHYLPSLLVKELEEAKESRANKSGKGFIKEPGRDLKWRNKRVKDT